MSKIKGHAHKFGDNINTDIISPAQYMEQGFDIMAAHAMEGADPNFAKNLKKGDMIVAGGNFGSGFSRETAPIALKMCGVSMVIARFFARIFYRNCINIGLPVLICAQADEIKDGDELEVDLEKGFIHNISSGKDYHCSPLLPHIMQMIKDGGLMEHIKKKRERNGGK
jgi:3-isopropylmalate/(R)-2-methylmalate dehydratase small subunit